MEICFPSPNCVDMTFPLFKQQKVNLKFDKICKYFISDCRVNFTEMILGRDWLKRNNVRLYCDLGLMRIYGKADAKLKENLHTSTIV